MLYVDLNVCAVNAHSVRLMSKKLAEHLAEFFGLGSSLLMGFQDVAFQPSRASFSTTFVKNCVRGESLRPPHVVKLWLEVIKGMLPLRYLGYDKASFCSR